MPFNVASNQPVVTDVQARCFRLYTTSMQKCLEQLQLLDTVIVVLDKYTCLRPAVIPNTPVPEQQVDFLK